MLPSGMTRVWHVAHENCSSSTAPFFLITYRTIGNGPSFATGMRVLSILDIVDRHNCRSDWSVEDNFSGRNPIRFRHERWCASVAVPDDLRLLPFQPVQIARRLVGGCIDRTPSVNWRDRDE